MELSAEDIKKHRALIRLQRGYEISTFIAFGVLFAYFLGGLELDLVLIIIGIELMGLCVAYLINPVSKVYGNLLSSVINSDKDSIINQHDSKS
ncbi:hypothetical protein [Thalassotalea hakodatensis]|uniref:hypothetical protein n=1 Tax=Thalassotalea hakodatensis TaxID=3030492 RepID=UPI002572C55B|nr:hypothetical protein [Thalassotalea hakodatensis]